ncbi:GNAT family N-acetyltransferase [Streptomyces sp. SKN60]|uniref:GNAT family N-acetyltransferase n=1 Tax=Streptomyces sp. SKN60 TaxID=2855506 RepID=UPI002246476B|nr:GNAT family N-acetyltransferase [Streptomyces sp. SKN60]MCX2181205.1 GNAT family N-acetyltransferase [Streptomyces sp. SKN60]
MTHRTTRPTCSVRPRSAADLPACVRILAEVHDRDGYPVNWPARPADWLAAGDGTAMGIGAWVAELDGRVAGHVALSRPADDDLAARIWRERNGSEPAVVGRLFVSPAARGHRIGAGLLRHVTAEARRLGRHPVLDVVASDTAAIALYERAGWRLLTTTTQRWSPERTVTIHCYAAPTP